MSDSTVPDGDHPRVCGEKRYACRRSLLFRGSPPRMRGKEQIRKEVIQDLGITPAYAGKRIAAGRGHPAGWDHPRVCGEKGGRDVIIRHDRGSPPRMRGKALFPCRSGRCPGITPAYAGKSSSDSTCVRTVSDHPRVCGEKPVAMHTRMTSAGSPPRMRGKGSMSHCVLSLYGITPAYAGKRSQFPSLWQAVRDHPRVCGEKTLPRIDRVVLQGSPPRMRGKDILQMISILHLRITPAYAGKSPAGAGYAYNGRDHPRVCGEKQMERGAGRLWVGSPPRMRGKVTKYVCKPQGVGITPAYAGKSSLRKLQRTSRRDHPRVCGEKILMIPWRNES